MKIFISYRRAEDNKSYIVGTIHEKLAKVFGKEDIFRDTYDIAGGSDWRKVLEREINTCKVMLVVIGPDWASLSYPTGEKRLFDEKDVTRWEVETGLRRSREENVALIPVLVTGAHLPKAEELPQSLQQLLEKNVINIRNFPDFDADMEKLIGDIRRSQGYAEEDISTEDFEPKTIYVAEGAFWMGSDGGEGIPDFETPRHEVALPAYRIGKYPVTNAQYYVFVAETRRPVDSGMAGWEGRQVSSGKEDFPVSGVSWYDALAYCEWLNKETRSQDAVPNEERWKYALPNEAQWEKACRGGENFLYPWGDVFDVTRCNHGNGQIAEVTALPAQNEFGCHDLVGNVLQWTCSLWGEKSIVPEQKYAYPWQADRRRNDPGANSQVRRVLRGSSIIDDSELSCRCSARRGQLPKDLGGPGARPGFRVVMNRE